MQVHIPLEQTESYETVAKSEVLKALEPLAEELMEEHRRKRRLWFPSDFLPADELDIEDSTRFIDKLRERARGITDSIRVSMVLNLLTEEGLPHFHRLISNYLGEDSVWSRWNRMWTAEEDRHGMVLHDYARDARLFRMKEVEIMQYAYQEAGFQPDWDKDPYRVFVYTTLQERATQVAHRNTGRLAGEEEPVLRGILDSVAADEAKHFNFYRRVFKGVLELDPNRGLVSASHLMPSIDMPGLTMPDFKEMSDVVRRMGIYTPWDYKKIVEEAIAYWRVEFLEGLNEVGRKAQDKIMQLPKRLEKVAQYIETRSEQKSFSFRFNYDRVFVLD